MGSESMQSADDLLLDSTDGELDLYAIFVAVIRSKRLIAACGLICALLAVCIVSRQKPVYQATVELLPPASSRSSGAAALTNAGLSDSGLTALGTAVQAKNQVDSFVIILQAWPIQESMVKRFDLIKIYKVPDIKRARLILSSRVTITGTREGFVYVKVLDTDKNRAADLANGYVDEARNFLRTLALSEASQRRVFYEGQLATTKVDLAKAEEAFRRLQQSTGVITVDTQSSALLNQAAALRSQITAQEVSLQALRSYSTAANPQVQIEESELSALRGQLSQLESRGLAGANGKGLSSLPSAQLDFVRATRELKYQEGLYDLMVRQYEGSKLDEARDAPAIQVIEPALPPDVKFGPHRIRFTLSGLGVGLLLGIIYAVFKYWRESSNEDQWAEVKQALHWKV